MTRSVVRQLVLKDLYLIRWVVLGSTASGAVSLLLSPLGGLMFYVGTVAFICVLVVLNIFVVMNLVAQEKKEKALVFVLSLPLSTAQYTAAKMLSGVIAFGAPWLTLTLLSIAVIDLTALPNGLIPATAAISAYLLLYYTVLFAVALTRDSATAMGGVIIAGNISINFLVPLVFRLPSVAASARGPAAVWGADIVTVVVLELAAGVLALAFAYVRQTRRTDFL